MLVAVGGGGSSVTPSDGAGGLCIAAEVASGPDSRDVADLRAAGGLVIECGILPAASPVGPVVGAKGRQVVRRGCGTLRSDQCSADCDHKAADCSGLDKAAAGVVHLISLNGH